MRRVFATEHGSELYRKRQSMVNWCSSRRSSTVGSIGFCNAAGPLSAMTLLQAADMAI